MPKRKISSSSRLTVSSVDAALDVLAAETFEKLRILVNKFHDASGIELSQDAAKRRWEDACKRHWVMKAMEDLCCDSKAEATTSREGTRPLPHRIHQGPVVRHRLSPTEESEWRRWTPQVGDLVVVELQNDEILPGKIIDRQRFFQGRTATRGNNFYPVRIYSKEHEPVLTVKSRLLPFDMRPDPPLLASADVQTAYLHARHPESFDLAADKRERDAAHSRLVPSAAQKAAWNDQVNWVMNERRVEKMRNLHSEREKRVEHVDDDDLRRKRTCPDRAVDAGIFKVPDPPLSPRRPISPRRPERKRIYTGLGEYSPRGRGNTYTPPRILPSGDETAVSPVPSSRRFEFCSPLGPARDAGARRGSLEAVKEEDDWQVVQRRSKRGESAPCADGTDQDRMEK